MNIERLHGDEREVTLMAHTGAGRVVSPGKLIGPVFESLKPLGPCLPLCDREGLFLPHGRLYRESGGILELAGADTWSPIEAVRQGALLRHAIAGALDVVERSLGLEEFVASQHNTAYTAQNPDHCTAGHFNVTRSRHLDYYLPALGTLGAVLPCISGGGGFDMETLQYTLSIRGLRCVQLTSSKTQSERGIIDLKPMPASVGDRQQILVVDNLQSHAQTRCVFTLLNLFFTCAENDPASLPQIDLSEPVEDMHRMIRGPWLDHPFTASDGRQFAATEILRSFVDAFASRLNADWMPAWAKSELTFTSGMIDRLHNQGLAGCVGLMDHASLYCLWQTTLNEHGLDQARAENARAHLLQMGNAYEGKTMLQEGAAAMVKCADALLGEAGKPSEDCKTFIRAARAFMQLAYAYGDIRHQGLHAQLVESGFAAEGVLFDRDHCEANAYSPVPAAEGRASARSKAIIELSTSKPAEDASATWDFVRARGRGILSLHDYARTDTDNWMKEKPSKEVKTLTDLGFPAMNTFLNNREERVLSVDRSTRPPIVNNEEGADRHVWFVPDDDEYF